MSTKKATLRLDSNIWDWVSSSKNEGQSDTSFLTCALSKASNETQDSNDLPLSSYRLELEELNKINKKLVNNVRKLKRELNKLNEEKPSLNIDELDDQPCEQSKDGYLPLSLSKSSINTQFLELNDELMDYKKNKTDLTDRIKELTDIEIEVRERVSELEVKIKETSEENSLLSEGLSLLKTQKEDIENDLKSSTSKTLAVADSLHKVNDENSVLKNKIESMVDDIDAKKEDMLKLSETIDRLSVYNEVSDNENKELSEKIISIDALNQKLSSESSLFKKKIETLKKEVEESNENNIQLSLERDESKQSLQKNMDAQEKLDLMSDRFKSMKDGFRKMKASRDLVKSQMELNISSFEKLEKIEISKNKKNIIILSGIICILIIFSGYCFLKGF